MTYRKLLARAVVAVSLIMGSLGSIPGAAQETIYPPRQAETPLTAYLPAAPCDTGNAHRQLWINGDFLFAFMRGTHVPTLASTSPVGTPRALAGVQGASTTDTLFGGWQNDDLRPGFRLNAGWWFGGDSNLGLEAGFMFVSGQSSSFAGGSDVFPILARPYIDANDGTPQAILVAFPGASTGSLDIRLTSGSFSSAHIDIAENALDGPGFQLTALVGYRYYRYDESLNIRQNVTVTDPNFIPGTLSVTNDSFSARNEFHGFDMGFRTQHIWQRVSLELLAKLAVGDVRRRINIAGDQTTVVPGQAPVFDQAGLLALSSNSGSFSSHDVKVLPEAGATLGWQIRPNLNVRLGYSFLFLNGIVRAADQVDVTLNPNLFPPVIGGGPNRPAFGQIRSDMWIQSLTLGVLWTF